MSRPCGRGPDAIAASLSGHLDYEDIQHNLNPDPADTKDEVTELSAQTQDVNPQAPANGGCAARSTQAPALWVGHTVMTVGATRIGTRGNWRHSSMTSRAVVLREGESVGVA